MQSDHKIAEGVWNFILNNLLENVPNFRVFIINIVKYECFKNYKKRNKNA